MFPIHDLETPCVLIDLERVTQNIERMHTHCRQLGLSVRAHVKTHKIPEIAQMQIDAGAVGIACQKVSEAEVFAEAGFNDILIPYNIVGPQKTARLVDLAHYNRVTVSADHPTVILGLAEAARDADMTIRVLVELATGLGRTGAQFNEVPNLAKQIEMDENLHFAGVLLYPSNPEERPYLREALAMLHEAGLGVDIVSGGGTGVTRFADQMPELTEVRVGTYITYDWRAVCQGWTTLDTCALTVATTVVSRPTPDRVILDAGSKTLGSITAEGGHGYIREYPDAYIYRLSVEHAHVDMAKCPTRPSIGERVHIVPVHGEMVINAFDRVYGYVGDQVEREWVVAARGAVW